MDNLYVGFPLYREAQVDNLYVRFPHKIRTHPSKVKPPVDQLLQNKMGEGVVVTGNGKRPPQSESGSDVWNDVTFTYPEPASTGRNLVARQDLVWQVPDARPTAVLEYIWSIWLSITLCIIGSHKVTSTISIVE